MDRTQGRQKKITDLTSTSPPECMMNDPSDCFIDRIKLYIPRLIMYRFWSDLCQTDALR